MFFQAPSSNVQRGPNHYSRSWPDLVLSSWWESLSKTRIRYRQGLGPSQLPLRHIRSLYVHADPLTHAQTNLTFESEDVLAQLRANFGHQLVRVGRDNRERPDFKNRVRSTLFSGRTASPWRFRSRKTGICRWSGLTNMQVGWAETTAAISANAARA